MEAMMSPLSRAAVGFVLITATLILEFITYPLLAGTAKSRAEQNRSQGPEGSVFVFGLMVAGYTLGIFYPVLAPEGLDRTLYISVAWGVALATLGIGLRIWCFRALGKNFTFLVRASQDQFIVHTGIYRYVRHPSYTGTMVVALGVALSIRSAGALLLIPLFTLAGLVYRIRVEERMLLSVVGERYRDYMNRTKRFIPFIV
jgi:protein-S-isoprenylcysteine O-methyltransferase Ste14